MGTLAPLTRARGLRMLTLLLGLGSLPGCTGVLPKAPEPAPTTYLLAPEPLTETSHRIRTGSGPTLLVSPPEAAAGFTTRRMAYVEQAFRIDYFADHAWVEAPAVMLVPVLLRALRDSPAFGAVSEDGRGLQGDLRLDLSLESLYQDFRTRPSQTRLRVRVRMVDPDGHRILATSVLADSEPAPTDDAYGGVVAANRALARLLPRITDFAVAADRLRGAATPVPAAADPDR